MQSLDKALKEESYLYGLPTKKGVSYVASK
jgi:hypothetical protein